MPENYNKLCYAEKCVALKHYFLGVRLADISRMTGAGHSTIRNWLKMIDHDYANIERLKPKSSVKTQRKSIFKELAPWVTDEIDALIKKNPFMGALKIKQYFFRHHQIIVPEKKVYFYLKDQGIIERRKADKTSAKKQERRFEYDKPLAAVQMDLMQLTLTGNKKSYLISIIDDHSRFMLTSRLVPDKTMDGVIRIFSDMIKMYGVVECVITDKGSEFVSWQSFTRFEELLCNLDIELIASGPDMPECQGKIERWHGTFRHEFEQVYGSFDFTVQAQLELDDFVNYYNFERPHQGINGLVPADRFYGLQNDLEVALDDCKKDPSQKIYFSCNINGEKIVVSGPKSEDLSIYRNSNTEDKK